MTSQRIADFLLILFVGGFLVPGVIVQVAAFVAWWMTGGTHYVPFPVPTWPVGV